MKRHISCSIIFFSENPIIYETMSKNVAETEGPQMTSQYGANALRAGLARLYARMRMHKPMRPGTHMHARTRKQSHKGQYVILIAFPQQQCFRERASVLRYTYIACLVVCNVLSFFSSFLIPVLFDSAGIFQLLTVAIEFLLFLHYI
jgi:hypothetical protein